MLLVLLRLLLLVRLLLLPLLRLVRLVLFCCSLSCWPWQGQPCTMGLSATSDLGQPWLLVLGLLLLLLLWLLLLLLPLMRLVRLTPCC